MKNIYYETARNGLIPCKFIGWAKTPTHDITGCYNAVIKLKRSKAGYNAGEVLHIPAWCVVEKAGSRDYKQLVRKATLPQIDPNSVMHSRWQLISDQAGKLLDSIHIIA